MYITRRERFSASHKLYNDKYYSYALEAYNEIAENISPSFRKRVYDGQLGISGNSSANYWLWP